MKQELIESIESSLFSALQSCKVLGLSADRFYRWRTRDSLIDKPPIAKLSPHKLLTAEQEEIVNYSLEHPEQRHRELWYNLSREGQVYVSRSSVYRVLKSEGLVPPHVFGKPHREKVKPDPKKPHEDWMIDITYIPIQTVDWYLIVLLDVYSRYIVGWELSSSMTWHEIQQVVDLAIEDLGLRDSAEKPRLHNDNGSQLKAKKLRQWLRELGVLQDFSRPKVPEDLAILERFMRTVKQEEVYLYEYPDQYEARDGIGIFIDYYNHRRPHQSLDYVTPYDMLIGRAEEVIQQRKKKHIAAQQRRKEVNKRMAD
ncbi:MAG: IS3 family transposase [Candidatus Thorarchaeota archaeon]